MRETIFDKGFEVQAFICHMIPPNPSLLFPQGSSKWAALFFVDR
jgi:hypothetical protein